jgi:hypothetical protein
MIMKGFTMAIKTSEQREVKQPATAGKTCPELRRHRKPGQGVFAGFFVV